MLFRSAKDQPGVFGKVASVLGEGKLSISEAFQRSHQSTEESDCASIHLQLQKTNWGSVETALEQLNELPFIVSTIALPILD